MLTVWKPAALHRFHSEADRDRAALFTYQYLRVIARNNKTVTYGELVDAVQAATGIDYGYQPPETTVNGRFYWRADLRRAFTNLLSMVNVRYSLPQDDVLITSLVVSSATHLPSIGLGRFADELNYWDGGFESLWLEGGALLLMEATYVAYMPKKATEYDAPGKSA